MSKSSKQRTAYTSSISIKSIIVFFIVVIIFVAFIVLWFSLLFSPSKIPVTYNGILEIAQNQGFQHYDITEEYYEYDEDYKSVLTKCLAIEKGDVRLVFFEFNNESSPKEIYQQARADIKTKYNAIYKIETDHQISNYSIYTLDSLGKYNVAIYVGNTAISGYCNSENKNEINKILDAIDYLKPGNNKETTE